LVLFAFFQLATTADFGAAASAADTGRKTKSSASNAAKVVKPSFELLVN
jgi:hypothetical protein